ncbi:FAD-dependent oxidoreductase [Ophiobolus disseminans]|uniref:FAD-dependent oxidoreductase n=1 Tax=Ophiobolus disseminans TaxID=1469910 RepID=A0A6A6ZGK4_9PLEO|nr:FAD-dependent oxidoreductase [Ophiobolus disseminans]
MDKSSRIVIVGAGVFGLSTALELAQQGYTNIIILDRHVPPVPDGSSVDISRIIRFDYGDATYTKIAKEAYDTWSTSPLSRDVFFKSPFAFLANKDYGKQYINRCTARLDELGLPWEELADTEATKAAFPLLYSTLPKMKLSGYCNRNAGWADAQKAITVVRDQCTEHGVSFLSGSRGTVTGFASSKDGSIIAAKTVSGHDVSGDHFILAAGAWSSKLVSMHNSTIATGQVLGYIKLTPSEVSDLKDLPIYINFDSGWFCFPPHEETGLLKVAVHGWGYTRTDNKQGGLSAPPTAPRHCRANFVPEDGVARLRAGLKEILPALEDREFERTAICWYHDTPSGDFILDHHPEHPNLFLATGGSGHGFKFLPVLGKYTVRALMKSLPKELALKWRFRTEYKGVDDVFKGDGSRGGPERRELTVQEKARL